MGALSALLLAALLSFSYKLVEMTLHTLLGKNRFQRMESYWVYGWAVLLIAAVPFMEGNYACRLPVDVGFVLPLVVAVLLTNLWIAKYSGYHPVGRRNLANFVIFFPVMEEWVYRGAVLPLLNQVLGASSHWELFDLSITGPILLTAFLFAVSHLQYYRLTRSSLIYMAYAFIGGVVFGAVADSTQSILFTVVLHIEFNLLCVYYAKRKPR
ncbi:CPBP family intramembrane glutamic endopeptidase [Gorillibacterium sp. CAU 1737]|uniref:CPBP family intramembrane glutamic endopeptidase n=1 Tax=Gorillibacterium sp. CAU 1737 TaxID=3140362 RepID=UPI00326111F0